MEEEAAAAAASIAAAAPSHDALTAAFDVAAALDIERMDAAGPPGYAALHELPTIEAEEAGSGAAPPSPATPSRPSPPLPTGQSCVLAVDLIARAAVDVTAASLDPAPGVEHGGTTAALPLSLAAGDVATVLVRVRRDEPADAASPGVLRVAWRRGGRGARLVVVAGEDDDEKEEQTAPPPSSSSLVVTATLPLPAVAFAAPLLAAATSFPPRAVAGTPLPLTLTLTAAPATPGARVGLAVADGSGFVVDGRRRGWIVVVPGGEAVERITLVPHAAGALALPAVTLSVEGGVLDATCGGVVVVAPAKSE